MLNSVSAVSENIAWAVGDSGMIIKTTNGGNSWIVQDAGIESDLKCVAATSAAIAWVAGGPVYKTTDGGLTWNGQDTGGVQVSSISAVDENTAWALGSDASPAFVALKTTDGGSTWAIKKTWKSDINYICNISAVDSNVAWAMISDIILRTTDGGEDWSYMPTVGEWPSGMCALDGNIAWQLSRYRQVKGSIFKTSDGGFNWGEQASIAQALYSIDAADENVAWCAGGDYSNGVILKTDDGKGWYPQVITPEGDFLDICVLNRNTAWAVGGVPFTAPKAVIYKTSDGQNWVSQSGNIYEPVVPSQTWYLTEGCTDEGFETWVLVQNPNGDAANMEMTLMTDRGPVWGPHDTIPANARRSYYMGDHVSSFDVSLEIRSDQPVICERAMYWNDRIGGHDSIGVTAPATTWYLAEGLFYLPS
ncbi:MAG: hypothetical protein JW854_03605 [Actinobacteria bacterium]|nr:hypothetical protein [Actinomycetota bacterium]